MAEARRTRINALGICTQIATPFNIDVNDPAGARFRRTGHDDVEFVGQVSELIN
jgi:hypothetical protein